MKFEIISYSPETTTNSFAYTRTKLRTIPSEQTNMRSKNPLFILLMVLSFLVVSFVTEAQASWLSSIFSPSVNQAPKVIELTKPVLQEIPTNQTETFQLAIKQIAAQLFANLDDSDPQVGMLADGIAFTVFADLKKLTRTSSFGRYLSEQLMGEFQQQGFPVIEVRKSNSIMVMEKRGEYGLSRDLDEIGSAAQARTMLTGTYTVAGEHIMVNAKILDNTTSAMLSSATVLFKKNDLTNTLLSDSASAYAKKDAYVYMKKLEL